jgi:hypothetical protein
MSDTNMATSTWCATETASLASSEEVTRLRAENQLLFRCLRQVSENPVSSRIIETVLAENNRLVDHVRRLTRELAVYRTGEAARSPVRLDQEPAPDRAVRDGVPA